jgi:Flp pilus assembly protein TadD
MRTIAQRFANPIRLSLLGFAAIACCGGCNALNGRAMNQAGSRYYKTGNYAMAQQNFQRAVADHPTNPNYRHNLAMSLHKQGRSAEAEQIYRQAIRIDPSHQPTYHGLAMLMRDQGRETEAAGLLASWAATQPQNPEAHIEMAWLNRETGDMAGAEAALRQALLTQPNHSVALAQLGQVYEQTGRTQEAMTIYRRSLHSNWLQPKVQSRMATLGRQSINRTAFNSPDLSIAPYSATAQLPTYGNGPAEWSRVSAAPELAVEPANADPAHVPDVNRGQSVPAN